MQILINECAANRYEDTILALLATCDNGKIDNMLDIIVKKETHYGDVSITYNDKHIQLIENHQLDENAVKNVEKIKRLPARYRNIPNDVMIITVDEFERELSIDLGNG